MTMEQKYALATAQLRLIDSLTTKIPAEPTNTGKQTLARLRAEANDKLVKYLRDEDNSPIDWIHFPVGRDWFIQN